MAEHIFIFLFSAAVIWFFSGILVESTSRIAHRFRSSGFTVAFLILGLITSIGEISVAFNSVIDGVPQVAAGNLSGASLVIFLLIIPFLAIFGNGVSLEHSLRKRDIIFALAVISLPSFFLSNGSIGPEEGFLMIALYAALVFMIITRRGVSRAAAEIESTYISKFKDGLFDLGKVVVGGAIIFWSSNLLVHQTLFFSGAFGVPASFIGLTILSIGTNVPELVIAVRAVLRRRKQVAFGDYLGSAAANTLVLGAVAVGTGRFEVAPQEFQLTFLLLGSGLILFYVFARSGSRLSRNEGFVIFGVYIMFLILQFWMISVNGAAA